MSKILAIDTSSFVMGVAVTDGDSVLGELTTNIKKNHSIRLMPAIDQLMKEVNVKPTELERVVVACGPGSYTGVRIGVTTAKTLAWSLGIPVVGVSSLTVMAQAGRFYQGIIAPLIDARRGQVYTGGYRANGLDVEESAPDRLTMIDEWLAFLAEQNQKVLFIGQDVSLHKERIVDLLGSKAEFGPGSLMLPKAAELARLGKAVREGDPTHAFVPNYLRLAEAEANWQEAQVKEGKGNG